MVKGGLKFSLETVKRKQMVEPEFSHVQLCVRFACLWNLCELEKKENQKLEITFS